MVNPTRNRLRKEDIMVITVIELAKEMLVLAVGCGLLTLLHRDLHLMAEIVKSRRNSTIYNA